MEVDLYYLYVSRVMNSSNIAADRSYMTVIAVNLGIQYGANCKSFSTASSLNSMLAQPIAHAVQTSVGLVSQ